MRTLSGTISTLMLTAALSAPLVIGGCSSNVGYRSYDPYHNDYHVWNNDEVVYYNRWEHDTHRDHQDFRKRNNDEQKEYWNWRHDQH
jgi:protein-tyrosine phosphatase